MRLILNGFGHILIIVSCTAAITKASYPNDVVSYWMDQTAFLINGTITGGLAGSIPAWAHAVVAGAMYNAAVKCEVGPLGRSLEYQQLAVSKAAHNALTFIFQGSRNYDAIDLAYRNVRDPILNVDRPFNPPEAVKCGQNAASEVVRARADDGHLNFEDYKFPPTFRPAPPGVYVPTYMGYAVPDIPQTQYIRFFGLNAQSADYTAPYPPSPTGSGSFYEENVEYIKAYGGRGSNVRTEDQTNMALFWRETSVIQWTRIASAIIGNTFAGDVTRSAKLFAQLQYAIANGVIVCWYNKFVYNTWRPESAIHRTDVYLSTGINVSDPAWQPLLSPTPKHQDYLSGHGVIAGAAAAALQAWFERDEIDVTVSSYVAEIGGALSRHFTSLDYAAKEMGWSRIYGGIHFNFTADASFDVGKKVGADSFAAFDGLWMSF